MAKCHLRVTFTENILNRIGSQYNLIALLENISLAPEIIITHVKSKGSSEQFNQNPCLN